MRIALISTPRSGNTWVRSVLAEAYGLDQIAVHNPNDLPAPLPLRAILQMHWYREPNLQDFLRRENFKVVVLARHPLDTMLSVLHFVRREPLTARWLDGNAELPADLATATPTSTLFRDWALSWGAENLLGVTYAWWQDRDAVHARYEDLVHNPGPAFQQLLASLGTAAGAVEPAMKKYDFLYFAKMPNRHGWQGRPGLWKTLIPPALGVQIYARHQRLFRTLGYGLEPYWLSGRQAAKNWLAATTF